MLSCCIIPVNSQASRVCSYNMPQLVFPWHKQNKCLKVNPSKIVIDRPPHTYTHINSWITHAMTKHAEFLLKSTGVRKNQFISDHTPGFLPLFTCRCYNSGSGSIPISCWNKRSAARPLGQHPDITLAIRPTNTNKQPQNKFASAAGLDGSLRKFTSGPPGHFTNE